MPAGFLNPANTNDEREKAAGLKPAAAASAPTVNNKAFFKDRKPMTPQELDKAAKAKAEALRKFGEVPRDE